MTDNETALAIFSKHRQYVIPMDKKLLTSIIFHNLRILHGITPRDSYIENYLWHFKQQGDQFFDIYHLAFWWGTYKRPKRILEIGSRSGLSLIQLLSAYTDFTDLRVCLCDLWNDGLCDPDLIKKHLSYLSIPIEPEFYQGDSKETVPKIEGEFDYILVDGSHTPSDAAIDLENAYKKISKDGVIVFDDIVEHDGVKLRDTWEAFKNKHFEEFNWAEDLHGKGVAWAVKL